MKWPFVRRSKYKLLEDQIEIYRKIHDEYAQLNHDNLHEINRLNQDLAKELNSHRETKKQLNFERDYAKKVEKELEETKDALKIAQEENIKLNDWISKNREASYLFVETIKKAINNFTK